MRRAHRTDSNQQTIVNALEAIGCSVAVTSALGNGFPDIVAGRNGINYMLEIKDGDQPPSGQALTTPEMIFHTNWKGKISIVNSVESALVAVGAKMQ